MYVNSLRAVQALKLFCQASFLSVRKVLPVIEMFIYGLFNEAVTSSDRVPSNDRLG
jgi:hypothetical protein